MLRGFLAFLLLLFAAGAGVYVLAQQKPQAARELAPVPVSSQAARSFDDKVSAVRTAVDEAKRTGTAVAIDLTLDEAELTSRANEAARQLPGGLIANDLQVHLTGGALVATSKVSLQGFDLNLGVVATPLVEDGKAKIVIKEIQTGAIALPEGVRKELESQVAKILDPKALGLAAFEISSMTIANGQLVILGTARP